MNRTAVFQPSIHLFVFVTGSEHNEDIENRKTEKTDTIKHSKII